MEDDSKNGKSDRVAGFSRKFLDQTASLNKKLNERLDSTVSGEALRGTMDQQADGIRTVASTAAAATAGSGFARLGFTYGKSRLALTHILARCVRQNVFYKITIDAILFRASSSGASAPSWRGKSFQNLIRFSV